jgi:endonuclease III
MAVTTNKQRVVNQIFTSYKKRYEPQELQERPVLEQFLYAICREGASREEADQAYRSLQELFFDWNELRVSSAREVEEALNGLPASEDKANRLISFLQEVFETTFSFDLESLHKKGLKQAAKQLSRYQASSDYVVAWVIQHSLGGHAIPIDGPCARILRQLGLLEQEEEATDFLRASLEHLIPKSRGPLFVEIMTAMAHDPNLLGREAASTVRTSAHATSTDEAKTGSSVGERVSRSKPR